MMREGGGGEDSVRAKGGGRPNYYLPYNKYVFVCVSVCVLLFVS